MFKKSSTPLDISKHTVLKSSHQRSIRKQVLEQMRVDELTLEQIWPKKEALHHIKCADDVAMYAVNGVPLFFQQGKDGPLFPTLRLIQQYPFILPKVQVDRGAIRFLLAGANMMCPGMTSPGGWLPPDGEPYAEKTPVAIFAEGKEHPAAIGITQMTTTDMRKVNKGVGVETITYLGDELWNVR